jgi:hypothetical protein
MSRPSADVANVPVVSDTQQITRRMPVDMHSGYDALAGPCSPNHAFVGKRHEAQRVRSGERWRHGSSLGYIAM